MKSEKAMTATVELEIQRQGKENRFQEQSVHALHNNYSFANWNFMLKLVYGIPVAEK